MYLSTIMPTTIIENIFNWAGHHFNLLLDIAIGLTIIYAIGVIYANLQSPKDKSTKRKDK